MRRRRTTTTANRRTTTTAIATAITLAALLPGCGSRDAPPAERIDRVRAKRSQTVARVNGVPVTVADVKHHLAGGGTPREALRRAIAFELLAQEARRRGIDRRPEVLRMQTRAAANLYIRRSFGDRFTPKEIPIDLVQQAYQLNISRYRHDEMVRLGNVLVFLPRDKRKRDPKVRREGRRIAERALAKLRRRKITSFDDIRPVVEELRAGPLPPGIRVSFETIQTTWLPGTRAPLSKAAFALKPGQLSNVVETIYAFYVVWLQSKLPAKKISLAEAEPEIREKIFKEARQLTFERRLVKLEQLYGVQYHPEALRSTGSASTGSASTGSAPR